VSVKFCKIGQGPVDSRELRRVDRLGRLEKRGWSKKSSRSQTRTKIGGVTEDAGEGEAGFVSGEEGAVAPKSLKPW
jgi:hypothetical protein